MKTNLRNQFWVVFLTAACSLTQAIAFATNGLRTPNFDKRREALTNPQMTQQRLLAATALQARVPSIKITYDEISGAPHWIGSNTRLLSGPTQVEVQRMGNLGFPSNDPHRAIKAFLIENAALFGHGIDVLTNATVKRDYVTAHNGMRTVVWSSSWAAFRCTRLT